MIDFLRSLTFALKGWHISLRERNMRLHLIALVLVIFLGFAFSLSIVEWTTLLFCIGMVISMELVNTALEEIVNVIVKGNKELYPHLGSAKDLGAGAVLVASLVSLFIGIMIFAPHLMALIHH